MSDKNYREALKQIQVKAAALSKAETLAKVADRLLDLHTEASCQEDKDAILLLAGTLCLEAKEAVEDM